MLATWLGANVSSTTKTCAVCALEIPQAARVCTHCGKAQNRWVRAIREYALAGAGLVALFPLFQATASLKELVSGHNRSEVTVKAAACQKTGITLVAMNFGKGPAFISVADFKVTGVDNPALSDLQLRSDAPLKAIPAAGFVTIISKGWIASIAESNLPVRGEANTCKYRVGLSILDASGERRREVSCDCPVS